MWWFREYEGGVPSRGHCLFFCFAICHIWLVVYKGEGGILMTPSRSLGILKWIICDPQRSLIFLLLRWEMTNIWIMWVRYTLAFTVGASKILELFRKVFLNRTCYLSLCILPVLCHWCCTIVVALHCPIMHFS